MKIRGNTVGTTLKSQVVNLSNIDKIYGSTSALPTNVAHGTNLVVSEGGGHAIYGYIAETKVWAKRQSLNTQAAYIVLEGEKKGVYRYQNQSPYFVPIEPKLNDHNTDPNAHEDIREELAEAAEIAAEIAAEKVAEIAAEKVAEAATEEVTRLVGELGVVQTTGDSKTAVMSQKAVTEEFRKLTIGTPGINKYKPVTEGFLNNQDVVDGVIFSGYPQVFLTPLIPVEPNTTYSYTPIVDSKKYADMVWSAWAYDADGKRISEIEEINSNGSLKMTTPSKTAFVRFTVVKAKLGCTASTPVEFLISKFNSTFMLVVGSEYPSQFIPYEEKSVIDEMIEEYMEEKGFNNPSESVNIVQTTGDSSEAVMSQKAVTEELDVLKSGTNAKYILSASDNGNINVKPDVTDANTECLGFKGPQTSADNSWNLDLIPDESIYGSLWYKVPAKQGDIITISPTSYWTNPEFYYEVWECKDTETYNHLATSARVKVFERAFAKVTHIDTTHCYVRIIYGYYYNKKPSEWGIVDNQYDKAFNISVNSAHANSGYNLIVQPNGMIGIAETNACDAVKLIKNNALKYVNADTIRWTNSTIYQGEYEKNGDCVSTDLFLALAGSTIKFDHADGEYVFRVTEFDLDKSYIKNTGNVTSMSSYDVENDCYIGITVRKATLKIPLDLSEGNSSRVMFDGYLEMDYDILDKISKMVENGVMQPVNADTIRWTKCSVYLGDYIDDPYCISCDQFFALAGSTITFSDKYTVRVTEFGLDKKYKTSTAYQTMSSYYVASDCYIAIGLRNHPAGAPPITEGNSTNAVFEGFIANDYSAVEAEITDKVVSNVRKNTFNNVYSDIEDVFTPALVTFASHTYSTGVVEPFVFFTDPHVFMPNNHDVDKFMAVMSNIQRLYNNSSANFLVCGGDWFSYSFSSEELCMKLGYIKGTLQNMFKNAYTAVGNHDIALDGTTSGVYRLDTQSLANALYGGRKCYYSFDGANTKCYVLDTGHDHDLVMSAYRWEQIDWLADQLKTEDAEHSLIFMHIYAYHEDALAGNPVTTEHVHPFARNIVDLVSAYNSKSTITLNGKEYDFSTCNGKMHCIISGHTHYDFHIVDNNVTIVGSYTAQSMVDGIPTFDMCVADYGTNTLYLTRVGNGTDRAINI